MLFINKVNSPSRDTSRESPASLVTGDHQEQQPDHASMALTEQTPRQSRMRNSFFGGRRNKRRSMEFTSPTPVDQPDNNASYYGQTSDSIDNEQQAPSFGFSRRRRLRKMSSKASLASVASNIYAEEVPEGRTIRHQLSIGSFWLTTTNEETASMD